MKIVNILIKIIIKIMILLLIYFVYSQTVNERVAECNPKIVCETVQ